MKQHNQAPFLEFRTEPILRTPETHSRPSSVLCCCRTLLPLSTLLIGYAQGWCASLVHLVALDQVTLLEVLEALHLQHHGMGSTYHGESPIVEQDAKHPFSLERQGQLQRNQTVADYIRARSTQQYYMV